MAESDIYLNIGQLNEKIIKFNKDMLNDINKAMKSICNTVGTLTVVGWAGASRDAFVEKFSEYKNNMRIFYENMDSFNKQMKTIYSEANSIIDQGSSKIRNTL